ncbi:MAG: DUF6116 family protein [Alphaproteobacteria bacterium]
MKTPQAHARDLVLRWLEGLQFPTLFLVAAGLFAADLVIPDMIPFADELLLGLATILLARLKQRKEARPTREARFPGASGPAQGRPTRPAPPVEVVIEKPGRGFGSRARGAKSAWG